MVSVDASLLDRLTATVHLILRGERPAPIDLPPDYPRDEFRQLVEYFNRLVAEYDDLAEFMYAMARGELERAPPPGRMRVLQSFKSLQANLRHLTWKAQQIAAGDLTQRVDFMGDFASAFNEMTRQLQQAFEDLRREKERSEQLLLSVTDSIRYAQRIQTALLPPPGALDDCLTESFTLWLPRDIVGGDIYCLEPCREGALVALLDCTGHGVPGALMSILAVTALRRLIRDEHCYAPGVLLARLNEMIRAELRQDTDAGPSDDGLDAAICLLQPDEGRMIFAGARLPLYVLADGQLTELHGDRTSLGYRRSRPGFVFNAQTLTLHPGMTFFLCTDGLLDQPGGPRGLPFGRSGLKAVLEASWRAPLACQGAALEERLHSHAGAYERRDDVTVLGWRVAAPDRRHPAAPRRTSPSTPPAHSGAAHA